MKVPRSIIERRWAAYSGTLSCQTPLSPPFCLPPAKSSNRSLMPASRKTGEGRSLYVLGKKSCCSVTPKSTGKRERRSAPKPYGVTKIFSPSTRWPSRHGASRPSDPAPSIGARKERRVDQRANRLSCVEIAVDDGQVVSSSKFNANGFTQTGSIVFQNANQCLEQFAIHEGVLRQLVFQIDFLSLLCGNSTIARRDVVSSHGRRATHRNRWV